MRCVLPAMTIAGAIAMMGCATQSGADRSPELRETIAAAQTLGLRVLTRVDVERLIVGHSIMLEFGRGVSFPSAVRETFLPNGEYRVAGHRNMIATGVYVLRAESICIRMLPAETCYIFLVDRAGLYYKKGVGSRYGPPEPIRIQ